MMNGLAIEKSRLEETLATEKEALVNEKQSLAEQLRDALNKMKELETSLVYEKSQRLEAETIRIALEQEKADIQLTLRDANEEISRLNNEKLKIEVTAERDRKVLEGLQKQCEGDANAISVLSFEISSLRQLKGEWEEEKDDLCNQILVLTEERDDARRQEEDLYDQLREKSDDLDRLQESYVMMTDRCNDMQDELSDLREKYENLQCTMAEHAETLASRPVSGGVFTVNGVKTASQYPVNAMSDIHFSQDQTQVRNADDFASHEPTPDDDFCDETGQLNTAPNDEVEDDDYENDYEEEDFD